MGIKTAALELIRRASTDLPPDVEARVKRAYDEAEKGSTEQSVFNVILENVKLARENSTPICQDTGHVIFYVNYPVTMKEWEIRKELEEATAIATEKYYLRPNAVDSVTGKNSGNNLGENAPFFTFHQWDKPELEIKLMLKGGGSENVGIQYKLPDSNLGAGRDLEGVRKCMLDAVDKAQGFGCAPGTLGVGLGGDRGVSYLLSKKNFFRKIGSVNENKTLAEFEDRLENELNSLGIGPMGFGGNTTVLDVFVASQHRHPATFYVSISYMCWAFRRKSMTINVNGEVTYAD